MKVGIYKYFFISLVILVCGLLYFAMVYSNRIVVKRMTEEKALPTEYKPQSKEPSFREGATQSDEETSKKGNVSERKEKLSEPKNVTQPQKQAAEGESATYPNAKTNQSENMTTSQEKGQAKGKDKKVNLNTASKEELMTLKGIGEKKANQIIQYRTEKGAFQKIEDIMKIKGIKRKAFHKIKDSITVSTESEE